MDEGPTASASRDRGAEFRGGRAATNTSVVFAGQVVVLLIALVTTPIALDRLGLVQFGIWTFVSTAIGFLTVIDPGLSDIVTRYGAQGRVRGDRHVGARVATLGSLVWIGFGVLIAPLVVYLVPVAAHHVHISGNHAGTLAQQNAAITFFFWSFGLIIFGSVLTTLSAQLIAAGEQWLVTVIDVATRVVYGVVLVVLLLKGWRLNAIVAATLCQFALAYGATLVAIALRSGTPFANPAKLDPAVRRELFRFGGLLQLSSVLDTFTYETDPIVLAVFIRASTAGIWGAAQRLARQVTYFAYVPQGNVLPAMAAAHAAGEGLVSLRRIYVRSQRIIGLLGAFLGGAIIAFAPLMFKAWLNRSFTTHDDAVMATFLVALTMIAGLPRPATANAILAVGRVGLGVRAQALAFFVNVVLTIALVKPLGLDGVLVGTVAAKVVATTYLLVRFTKMVESNWRDLVWPWLGPLLVVTGLTATAGRLAVAWWPAAVASRLSALAVLALLGVSYSALYAVGLRVSHYFSRGDVGWIKGALPGPAGKLLTPRVERFLCGPA